MSALRALACVVLILCTSARAFGALLSPHDVEIYRAAFAAGRTADWTAARQIADQAQEKLPAKVLHWLELSRSGAAAFADIVAFADENPDWPLQAVLRQKAEEASGEIPDGILLPYFQKHHPTTPQGKLRLADMLAAAGQQEAAVPVLRDLWLSPDLDPDTEKAVLDRYAAAIRLEEHSARLDRLLRDGMESAARRELPWVPEDQRLLAEARLALAALQPNADDLATQLPEHLRSDPGLLLDRARWNRRKDMFEQAARFFLPPETLSRPAMWWPERQLLARRLLDAHQDQLAYDVISRHGLGEGTAEFADAEFLSGWIALRRLKDASAAYTHFTRLHAAVKLSVSIARGAYWAGRAAEALATPDAARDWLAIAARRGTTYYGQLAAARLGMTVLPEFPPEPVPSAAESTAFERQPLVHIARLLAEIGERDAVRPFLLRLGAAAKTPAEQKLVAGLAEAAGRLDVAIAAAKQAGADGVPLLAEGFPVISIARKGVAEPPLVLAITRQESAFDEAAVSRSDARGLMQLKPSTAKDVAKALAMPFAANRLLTDASYNLTLGHAYLDKMLGAFNGSYVLAIAAYNAGPNRVAQWLASYGDPRDGSIDVVDWIELIPFGETRNYVQRVLENLQVYRLRLEDRALAFTLPRDLQR